MQVTCFFLGWIGERFPHLVKEAAARGHEIASHGYGHQLVFKQTRDQFHDDVRKARLLLEDIAGAPVLGYRAPGFSTTDETPWFFDALVKAGYQYDSSLFPAARGHGGVRDGRRDPHRIGEDDGIIELPISVADMMGKRICFFGGGYLRLFPYWLIRKKAQEVLAEGRPVVFYIHPREIDPKHPRLPMSRKRTFKSYVNLDSTEWKVRQRSQGFSSHHVPERYRPASGIGSLICRLTVPRLSSISMPTTSTPSMATRTESSTASSISSSARACACVTRSPSRAASRCREEAFST